jgi:hypothetical protein
LIESSISKLRASIFAINNKLNSQDIPNTLNDTLTQRWSIPTINAGLMKETIKAIDEIKVQQRFRIRGISNIKELFLVIGFILIIVVSTWGGNNLLAGSDPTATPLKTVVVTQLVFSDPTPSIVQTIEPLAIVATPAPSDVLYKIGVGEDLDDIASKLDVSKEELSSLNRIQPDGDVKPNTWLLIPGRLGRNPPEATPVIPAFRPKPLPPEPSIEDLLQRMKPNEGRYHTLWLDALIIDYGPIGYVGPPKTQRSQAWFSENQSLIITGQPGNIPDDVLMRIGRTMYRARPRAREPWFATYLNQDPEEIEAYDDLDLLFETVFDGARIAQSAFTLSPTGKTSWAGQPSVAAELLNDDGERTGSLLIDEASGLTLREQWYSSADSSILSQEISVNGIAYDIDFPQDLFDVRLPWRGGYAADYTGTPEDIPADPLPSYIDDVSRQVNPVVPQPIQMATLDYKESQITFDFRYNFITSDPSAQADIYLDRRFIGTSVFGNPWTSICERSPDGRKIAYVSEPFRSNTRDSVLRWINLDGPFGLGRNLDGMVVTHFSWAPDNVRMAVFGYDPIDPFQTGQLLILNTGTGERRTLLEADAANSLVWKPDGERLALIVRPYQDSFEEQVLVVDAEDGGILSRIPLDVDGTYSDDWPMDDWETEFPVLQGGIEQCTAPR